MYSRNKLTGGQGIGTPHLRQTEYDYTDNVPTVYSGTLFPRRSDKQREIPARDERPREEVPCLPPAEAEELSCTETEVPSDVRQPSEHGFSLPRILADIGQEEVLLLLLLLVLSGEKEHPMDILIVLLLLLSIQ